MALAAYFDSSALAQSITMIGASVLVNGAYSSCISATALGVVGADHHAIGLHEVVDRGALLQELGVADHAEGPLGLAVHRHADAFGRADGHRALGDHHRVARDRARNLPGHVEHVPQVGRPVLPLRRADGDEDHRRVLDGRGQRRRERQPLLAQVSAQQLLEPGLVDRHLAGLERTHLGGVLVHAHHVVPALRKAHTRHEPHIPSSNHRNVAYHPGCHDDKKRKRYHTLQMRVLVDYRPALRARTGAGAYVHGLVRAYTACHGDAVTVFSSSWKDRVAPGTGAALNARVVDRRVPVRWLNYLWHRREWPPVESMAGPADVVHAGHPLLIPATSRGAGGDRARPVLPVEPRRHPRRDSAGLSRRWRASTPGAPTPW